MRLASAWSLVCVGAVLSGSCRSLSDQPPGSGAAVVPRPNILWIYVDDMNDWMGAYGDTRVPTPHIDALARAGVRFDRAYMPAPVCSATRSALITGAMQTSLGLHNHRSSRVRGKHGMPDPIHLPPGVSALPELFRRAGYHTFNKGKTDYNFVFDPKTMYDHADEREGFQEGAPAPWSQRRAGQPFFGQIHLRGGKCEMQKRRRLAIDPTAVPVPPYYPDHPAVRRHIATHYDCIARTDVEVGQIMRALRDDGLAANTVVFFFTDHGYTGMRDKQFLYEGGIRVPLIASWPGTSGGRHKAIAPGLVRKDVVSGIDISASSLRLAGIALPAHVEGKDLFAADYVPRDHIIAARDRCDYTIDRIRAVVTPRWKYIRNFMLDRPYMQPQYRDDWPHVASIRALADRGQLDETQALFMAPARERPAEELYDLEGDPHEVKNLASRPEHAAILQEMRDRLTRWIATTGDRGQQPESEAGLLGVLHRWRNAAVNPEYAPVRAKLAAAKGAGADPRPFTQEVPGSDATIEMVPIPGGRFLMGSPDDEAGHKADEGPRRELTLRPFYMSKHEITWDAYAVFLDIGIQRLLDGGGQDDGPDAITHPTPPYADETFGFGGGRQPAIALTIHAVNQFARWLSQATGKRYRLPTEAEWEYACRAGREDRGLLPANKAALSELAWYHGNAAKRPHPVGLKQANPFGLHDMHGNVAEWVLDRYEPDFYARARSGNLLANLPDHHRFAHVVRGGGWKDDSPALRCGARRHSERSWSKQDPQTPQSIWWHTEATDVGFRLVHVPDDYPELKDFRSRITEDSP